MLIAAQYKLFWLIILIGGVLVYLGKDTKTFIIVLAIIFCLYIVQGTAYEQYSMYIAAIGSVIYMLLNKEESGEAYNPNDQYADLLKGLGGG